MAKIAYILSSFPVISETFIINEIRELKRQGVDIAILSLSEPRNCIHKEAEELIENTYYFKDKSRLKRILKLTYGHLYFFLKNPVRYLGVLRFVLSIDKMAFSLFLNVSYIALVLKRLKVKAIHAHFATTAECSMLVSMITGIPYSFTVHAYDIFIRPRLIREKVKYARFVTSISEFNKEFIKNRFFEKDGNNMEQKIKVIHCGVDLDKLSLYKSESSQKKGSDFIILSTGRLIEKKGHRYLIEACRILEESGFSNFLCKIIGDGPLRDELCLLVSRLELGEKILLLGSLSQDEVFKNLKKADLFVLPCIAARNGDMDGIPVSLIEAMAFGKPVISTNISGIPELVKEGAGVLVPPGDSKAIADAIREVICLDHKERAYMGRKGREIVLREFDLRKNVEQIKSLLLG